MSIRRKLPAALLALAMAAMLAGCSGKAGAGAGGAPMAEPGTAGPLPDVVTDAGEAVPDAGETVPDAREAVPDTGDVVTDAGEAVPDAGEVVTDAGEAVPDVAVVAPGVEKVVPDAAPEPAGDAATEGPGVPALGGGPGPDYWAAYVVPLEDVLSMTDAEATASIGHISRKVLHEAWGGPDEESGSADGASHTADRWLSGTGAAYVDVYYDPRDGNVSEVLPSPAAALPDGFAGWVAELPEEDGGEVLDALLSAGATRHAVREALGDPAGCVASTGTVYAGDVYLLDTGGMDRYVRVMYGGERLVTVPQSVELFDRWHGLVGDPAVCKEPYAYIEGVHDSFLVGG